jgi:hypothetical protein
MKSEAESTASPTKVTIAAPFPRQCKTCRKTLTYANRRGYMRALKADSECAACAARGIRLPITDGSGFPRECPVCHKGMMYRYEATADAGGALRATCMTSPPSPSAWPRRPPPTTVAFLPDARVTMLLQRQTAPSSHRVKRARRDVPIR